MGSWLAARVSVALGRAVHKPDRADQIPIALAAPQRPISRGFLPWRLSDDGPTSVAPSSWAVIRNPAQKQTPSSAVPCPLSPGADMAVRVIRWIHATGMRLSETFEIDSEACERGIRYVIVG